MIETLFTLYIQSTLPRRDTFETSTMAVLEKWLFYIESQLREVKKGREAGRQGGREAGRQGPTLGVPSEVSFKNCPLRERSLYNVVICLFILYFVCSKQI